MTARLKASSVAEMARMMVLPKADATSVATGRPVPIEVPKSPVRVTPSQRRYWIGNGLSKP